MDVIQGEVERVWPNRTQSGKRYNVIEVGGARYSLWDADYFDKIEKGDKVEFEYKESGKFKNIVKVYDGSEPEPGNGGNGNNSFSGSKYTENDGFSNGSNGDGYGTDRLSKMVRMSCLKSASPLVAGTKVAYGDRADKTIELAQKFEQYINGDLDSEPMEPVEPDEPVSPQ